MSSVNSYNEIVDRLSKFAAGHFNVGAFTHGQIDLMDLDKFPDYVCMHVFPASITLQKGSNIYAFTIWFMDLPRDKELKPEYQREAISDTARIASDLVYEIENGLTLFGDDIVITGTPTITPEIQEYSNVLTGVSLQISIDVPSEWEACDIPADWTAGGQGETEGPAGGPLLFEMSVVKTDGVVTLVNDEDAPGNSYYYGTDETGVKGWYILTGGGGSQDLQSVTDIGNTTTNDIELIDDAEVIFGAGGGVLLDNGSRMREGTIDAGNGGVKGIALICGVGYEFKWEAGRLYIMNGNGDQIRESRYNFNITPDVTDDSSKGYYADSRWILDNGDIYVCTDSTIGAAVWVLQTDVCQCDITAEVDENGDLIITVNEDTPINAGHVVGPQGDTGPQGSQGDPGPQGEQGTSSTFFPYKAKTSATSGNPGLEYLLWNNATQISATQINVSHEDDDNIDVDIFLALIAPTQKFTIQDANDSANFQTWQISGTPTNINPGTINSYWTYPVTFVSSGGTGTTNFSNNHNVIFAVVSGIVGPQGPTGPTGPQGPAGPAPSGTGLVSVTSGVLDTPFTITAARAVISSVSGLPTASATTATELGYVSGVTSAIQTQLNNITGATRHYLLASNFSLTTASETDITGYAATVEANSYYDVAIALYTGLSGGSTGIKFGFKYPASSNYRISEIGRSSGATAMVTLGSAYTADTGLMALSYNTAAQASGQVMMRAVLVTGANAGTFQMTMASANGAQTSTIYKNSLMILTKFTPQP